MLEVGHRFCFAKAHLSASLGYRKINFSVSLASLKGRTYGSRPTSKASENKIKPFQGLLLFSGAGSRTRTYEGRSREIYSLLSLPLDDSSIDVNVSYYTLRGPKLQALFARFRGDRRAFGYDTGTSDDLLGPLGFRRFWCGTGDADDHSWATERTLF